MIEAGLRTLLLSHPGITSLIPQQRLGNITFDGIFNEYPEQNFQPPFIVLSQTNFDPMECLDGTRGMEASVFEIDCYASNHPDAKSLGNAVSSFLKDYSGSAGERDTINAVHWEDKRYDRVQLDIGLDARHHIVKLTFRIQHTAA